MAPSKRRAVAPVRAARRVSESDDRRSEKKRLGITLNVFLPFYKIIHLIK